jgi:hypothetical protein
MLIKKLTLVVFTLLVLQSCANNKAQQEQLKILSERVKKLEGSNNLLVKTLNEQKERLKNYKLAELDEQITKNYILDKYNTEIAIDGKIQIMPNTYSDYDIAVQAISFNQRDRAIDILFNLRKDLEVKIESEKTKYNNKDQKNDDNKNEESTKTLIYLSELKYETNYLIAYLSYIAKDFKTAVKYFMENYNYEEQNTWFKQKKSKFIANSLGLAYSFYNIGRFDKYCQTIDASKINDKSFVENQKLYDALQVNLAITKSCKKEESKQSVVQ